MDQAAATALSQDKVIDITTTGRRSGEAHRIEIWYHRVEGRYLITGRPGPRSWYADLVANPTFTFHLKESAEADLPARAIPITKPQEKARLLSAAPSLQQYIGDDLDSWVQGSPLVEVVFTDGD
ncbi:MAG: nitroreductase/quinone reductase family protein [Chloroflexi bacterium]|nr:nitroreductase/quinone reductase family protein [Chloroflexota bacterium]